MRRDLVATGAVLLLLGSAAAPREGWRCADRGGSERRLVRGVSPSSSPSALRGASRQAFEPAFRAFNLGLRCAKDAP